MLRMRMLFAVSAVVAIVAVAIAPTPIAAERPYKWKLVCRGPSTLVTTVEWHWTVNATVVTNETAICTGGASVEGTGTRPPTANDFAPLITVYDNATGLTPAIGNFTDTFDEFHHFGDRFTVVLTDHEEAVFAVNSWPA